MVDERTILNHVAGVDESQGIRRAQGTMPMLEGAEAEAVAEAERALGLAAGTDARAQADQTLTQAKDVQPAAERAAQGQF